MKKRNSKQPALNRRRFLLVWIAIAVVVAATAVTVISRQKRTESPVVNRAETKPSATGTRTYITRRVGGQDVHIDTQSGDIKPLTPEEARRLAEGLAPMVDRSTEGLKQVTHPDGSVSMDLQGRFQSVTVARVNTDGTVEQSCVDNPKAAARFFGINPMAIEDAQAVQKRTRQIVSPN